MGEGIYLSGQHFTVRNEEGAEWDDQTLDINIENVTLRDVTMDVEFGPVLVSDRPNIRDVRLINNRIRLKNSANRSFFGDALDLNPGSLSRPVPHDSAYWLYAENVIDLTITDTKVRSELAGEVDVADHRVADCVSVTFRDVDSPATDTTAGVA